MTIHGRLLSIYIRPQPSEPVLEVDQVNAVPGKGLEGDYWVN